MLVEGDLALLQAGLGGVLCVEDVVELLEGAVLGLGDEEVDDDGLDGVPDDEDDVRVPADALHGDGPRELVEEHGCAQTSVKNEEELGEIWGREEEEEENIPALSEKLENAIPFALISKLSTSTGYSACSGVIPKEKTAPNRKIMAVAALEAEAAMPVAGRASPLASSTLCAS